MPRKQNPVTEAGCVVAALGVFVVAVVAAGLLSVVAAHPVASIVTGRAGDLGADVVAFAPDGRKIVLQAKRFAVTHNVTGPDLQRFGGTCYTVHGARVAAVVTTSTFTKQAREYAAHHGIRLFDARGLAAWASRTGPAPWH
ncbi:restriction endonuclease [Amycolatopsis sp. NPDC049252]|uniref:restriction endonuclease n=1 Tax=Amycolatopsis sp. NPDC049252 TaxID=3363933 RepID=UPI00370FB4C8